MKNSATHIFLLLLVMTIGGGVLQQHTIPSNGSSNSSVFTNTMHCQQSQTTNVEAPTAKKVLSINSSEGHNTDTDSKTTSNCNSLVNLLHSESNFSFNPGSQPLNTNSYNAFLSSQIFVFQEPDPPQIG